MINKDRYEHVHTLGHMLELKIHQRKSRKELSEIQLKKLKKMVNHAYNNVPYYRDLFDRENISPGDIKKIEDLQKLPILDKKDIQADYDKMLANNVDKGQCKVASTTGSTGIPLLVYKDRYAMLYSSALVYFAFFEAGLRMKDRFVELTGIMGDCSKTAIKKTMISIYDSPEMIIDKLRRYNPNMIYSFPSIFKTLSYSLNGELLSPNMRMIFTHGETLTEPCRKTIESAFGAEVYNTYGSTEFNRLAFECSEHSGLHMITDCAIIELIKNDQNVYAGEEGEIIVTGLYNYAMPLIRYRLGDIGILADDDDKCPCGRGWPLIKNIEGRSDDFLTLPSGRVISPQTMSVLEHIPDIIQYKTIQEKKDKFIVQVVPGKDFSVETEKRIDKEIRLGCLGENISIEIELVDEIPRERTGKLRAIVSKV